MKTAVHDYSDLKCVAERQLSMACNNFYRKHLNPSTKLEVWILDINELSIPLESASSFLYGIADGVSLTLDGLLPDITTRSRLLHNNVASDLQTLREIIDTLGSSVELRETYDIAKAVQSSEERLEALSEWQTLGSHLDRLNAILPDRRELNMIIVDATPFKFKVQSPLLRRMESLRLKLVSTLESDTSALRHELTRASETLTQSMLQPGQTKSMNGPLISLAVYLEQMNVVSALNKKELRESLFAERLSHIRYLSSLLGGDGDALINFEEIEEILENLPRLIEECERRLLK